MLHIASKDYSMHGNKARMNISIMKYAFFREKNDSNGKCGKRECDVLNKITLINYKITIILKKIFLPRNRCSQLNFIS